jgi:hypothetical protein
MTASSKRMMAALFFCIGRTRIHEAREEQY